MPQQIDVPGMGIVEFPDGMDDAAIASAIQRNLRPPDQGPQQPPPSGTEAFGRGVTRAASFGFLDELAGTIAAGGAGPNENPAATIAALGRGAYRRLTGDPEAARLAEVETARVRAENERLEEGAPGATIGGQVVGAVAMPLPALRAATWGGRALQAAGLGAATGALTGAGEAEGGLAERGRGAATGGLIGGAAGGVLSPALGAVGWATRRTLGPAVATLRSVYNPTGQAERNIGRAYQQAVEADPTAVSRLAPSELGQGRPGVVMDVLGDPGGDLARSAANISPAARTTLTRTLDPRLEAEGDRFTTWFRQWSNYPDAYTAQEALEQAGRTANRANYAIAMRQGNVPLQSNVLERLAQDAPPVQTAMKAAAEAVQTRAAAEGRRVPQYRNLEFWDATRKQISDSARAAGRAGRNEEAAVLGDLARTINGELDAIVPSYRQARASAAQFFGAENAYEAGQKFVNQNFGKAETRAALNKMSQAERALFEDGFSQRMMETIAKMPDRSDVTRRIWGTQDKRDQIELVLGRARADQLEAMTRVENIMRESRQAVKGNSTSVRQFIGAGLAGATGGAGGYYGSDFTGSGVLGAVVTAFAKHKLDQRVANRVATMLMSSDPKMVDRGIKMIANNERFMGVLRAADSALARVGGSQAGGNAP